MSSHDHGVTIWLPAKSYGDWTAAAIYLCLLGVTARGSDLRAARDLAYAVVDRIRFYGAHYRRDIAAKALAYYSL